MTRRGVQPRRWDLLAVSHRRCGRLASRLQSLDRTARPRPVVVRAPSVVVVVVVVVGREGPRARRAPVPRRALVAPVQGQGRALSAPGSAEDKRLNIANARAAIEGRREGRSRARRPPRDVELPVQQRLVRGVRRDHRTRARSLDRRRGPTRTAPGPGKGSRTTTRRTTTRRTRRRSRWRCSRRLRPS